MRIFVTYGCIYRSICIVTYTKLTFKHTILAKHRDLILFMKINSVQLQLICLPNSTWLVQHY